jgi:Zn-dependent protease
VTETEPTRPPRPSGPRGLRFNLFGFPTQIDPSFLLIVALIGFEGTFSHVLIWVAVAVVAVLGHELGHALAARSFGATATITLAGLGGLTRSVRDEPLGRGESAVLTAAGPLAGILLGLPVLYALHAFQWPWWTNGGYALRSAAFTTLGWSGLNLLPMLPLDGGHLLELALPGTPVARRRLAAQISIAVAAGAGFAAYRAGYQFSMLLAVMFGAQNLALLKQTQPAQPAAPRLSMSEGAALLLQPVPPRNNADGSTPAGPDGASASGGAATSGGATASSGAVASGGTAASSGTVGSGGAGSTGGAVPSGGPVPPLPAEPPYLPGPPVPPSSFAPPDEA